MAQRREASSTGQKPGLLGSLKDALAAAGRADAQPTAAVQDADLSASEALPPPIQLPSPAAMARPLTASQSVEAPVKVEAKPSNTSVPKAVGLSAAEAARTARGEGLSTPQATASDIEPPPTTRVVKTPDASAPAQTQFVRGKQKVERGGLKTDPVVGWLVIVGGPGIGNYRPVFEGNNTVGRSSTQRIPLDFGDDAISSEEQAYIRYDSSDRSFLFVPNLAKTNVVSLNDKRPTGAVELRQMDVIVIGRTQLVFVPFCGTEFDWSELVNANKS